MANHDKQVFSALAQELYKSTGFSDGKVKLFGDQQVTLLPFHLSLIRICLSVKVSISENNESTAQKQRMTTGPIKVSTKISRTPYRTFCQQNAGAPRRGWASSAGRQRNTAGGALFLQHTHTQTERIAWSDFILGIAPSFLRGIVTWHRCYCTNSLFTQRES